MSTPGQMLDNLLTSVQQGAYTVGGKASQLTGDAKNFLGGYVEWAKKSQTAKTLDEYRAYLASTGTTVSSDVYNTSKDFMANTDTGKALQAAWKSVVDTVSGGAKKDGKDDKHDAPQQTGFFAENRVGIITGAFATIASIFLTGNPLIALLVGVASAAAGNFFFDQENSYLKSFFPKTSTATTTKTAGAEEATSTPAQNAELVPIIGRFVPMNVLEEAKKNATPNASGGVTVPTGENAAPPPVSATAPENVNER